MAARDATVSPKRGGRLYAQFIAFDASLARHGVHPVGRWFRRGLRRWFDAYQRGEVLELVACVGRGSAKSTCIYKLALFFTLFGDFEIPTYERHYAMVLSKQKEEAAKGIAIIAQWLKLLGVAHSVAGDVISLEDSPRGVRVVAASVAATSGWRAFFIARDERSKWSESGIADEDADEIDTSAAAMTTTHPNAPIIDAGSAWGNFGSFYEAVTAGDTDGRIVLGPAPTWVATDGRITEAMCRRKERSERKFRREYACEFQGSALAALDLDELRACVRVVSGFVPSAGAEIVMDPSGGSGNACAWAAFQWGTVDERPVLRMFAAGAVVNARKLGMTFENMADAIAGGAKAVGASQIHSDQHAAWSWESAFTRRGLTFNEHAWSGSGAGDQKENAVTRARELIRERVLVIEPGDEADALLDEASRFQERISPSGKISFAPSKGNDDRVLTLLLAARVDSELELSGSPLVNTGEDVHMADVQQIECGDALNFCGASAAAIERIG